MSRHLRFIPDGGALVEVTCRTVQGRLLLVPSPQLNDIILGVLGRAQRLYPVDLVAYVFASNHFHLLTRVDNAKQLSDFVGYFNSNLAKEIGRRTGWKEKVWGRRYQAIVISEEEEMQVARLRYCLAHGVKECLVSRVVEWPGVHCAVPLMTGSEVLGTWFDRTREYNARSRKGWHLLCGHLLCGVTRAQGRSPPGNLYPDAKWSGVLLGLRHRRSGESRRK